MQMKHLLAVVAICLIFFSAVAAGQFANLVSANFMPPPPELPHVYIRSDGNVEPQTLPIQRVGESYIFNGNVFNFTLEVQRGNIVLDGAGYTLQGNGSGIGIILSTIGNVTVKNLGIHSFRTGIDVENSSGNVFMGSRITNNELGIALNVATNNQILGNQITGNSNAILLYAAADYNSIIENNITKNGQGIWCEFSNYNVTNDYNNILRNNITENTGFGILMRGCSNNRVEENNISGNEYGITLSGSSCKSNTFAGNKIVGNSKGGIGMGGDVNHNTFSRNTIAYSEVGIDIFASSNNQFSHNDFISNKRQVNNGYANTSISFIAPSVNSWERNFWSDHNNSASAIYVIDATNIDHYPLATPYNGQIKPQFSPVLAMPQEYINYTVFAVNGTLWAKIDGTYPMNLTSGYSGTLPMLYPIPLGTTNIHVKLDAVELSWGNYSEVDPTALHHTDIGDWSMIYCVIAPASSDFVLGIHYEHPVQVINGTYAFLYDLNISPYLSPANNRSTAHFSVRLETNVSGVNVYTTGFNGTWSPMSYVRSGDGVAETVAFDVTSEFDKLLGDVAVTLVDVQVPEFPSWIVLPLLAGATLTIGLIYKKKSVKN
jgi:parallel beta-helix repeat protein